LSQRNNSNDSPTEVTSAFSTCPVEANVKPHKGEDCGSWRGNVLLARGLNRFDNWFEKNMDDFANEQLGLAGYATSMVTRGTFLGEDSMEDKRLAAIGPNPLGLCMCGCGRKTKIVTKSDRRHGHVMGQPFRFIHGHRRPAKKGSNRFKLVAQTVLSPGL
jgi:hypothetical protein